MGELVPVIKGDTKQITFKFKDLATMLVKEAGIHEGYWSVFLRFGIQGANVSLNAAEPVPTAIVPVIEIGIGREDEQGPLAVDAAIVNPAKPQPSTKKGSAKKKSTSE